MAVSWLNRKEEKDDDIEIKVPKEVTEKLSKIDSLETSFKAFETKSAVLDEMSNFLREQKEAKEAARKKEALDAAKKAEETKADPNEQWMSDPAKAFDEQSMPLKIAMINTQSQLVRREIFDDGKEFEFYHGDFKKEVDGLIDNNLNPATRADPQSIKNCYYLVLGRKQNEIRDGKIKSKFASTSTSSAKSGNTGSDPENSITLSDAQKKAADKLGVKQEDYAKAVREINYV